MANLAQMKAEAAKQGAQAPANYPGGPDKWVEDWYANAKAAGSIVSERPANYAGPQDAEAQGHNYSQAVSGASGWQPGQGINPQQLRKLSKEQGWSEDFNRYSDAQLQAWIDQSWDPQSGRFRSEGGGGALVEKPTECPPGTTLHGSKCISNEQANSLFGGGYGGQPQGGGGGGGAAAGPMFDPGNPLQAGLVNLFQERGGMFAGQGGQFGESLSGGGIWTGSNAQTPGVNPALTQATLTAFTPAAPSQQSAPKPAASAAPSPVAASLTSAYAGGITGKGSGVLQPGTAAPTQTLGYSQPSAGGQPLQQALAGAYKDPNQWWKTGARAV